MQCCAVSLSFGALAINDVVAAALTVAFCEVRTQRTNHRAVLLYLYLYSAIPA